MLGVPSAPGLPRGHIPNLVVFLVVLLIHHRVLRCLVGILGSVCHKTLFQLSSLFFPFKTVLRVGALLLLLLDALVVVVLDVVLVGALPGVAVPSTAPSAPGGIHAPLSPLECKKSGSNITVCKAIFSPCDAAPLWCVSTC